MSSQSKRDPKLFKRYELQLHRTKDAELVKFLEEDVDNVAGLLKMLAREHMIKMKMFNNVTTTSPEVVTPSEKAPEIPIKTENKDTKTQPSKSKKRMTITTNVMSSKDLDINNE
ncbi:hypothetical protein KM915_20920 [Cytobacillus oceanisediminis]|uniref:hypothetical protein n=1 Tax=Cytobacillus oceanisediminis TaxID=665099 RepID=UPI001C247372|nr:hypothetical protein [Cytobacillus oceanisediminis]MBU8732514.1 hypothetical protein [Cytobacillus oceanisediminis]